MPFQNLRASRQTELEPKFPTCVVCKWLGNTPRVALKHDLTVTDEDYQKAVQNWGLTGDATARRRTHRVARMGKRRQKPLTGRGLCEIVRLLAMWCQRPKWRGQDSSGIRFPRVTGT